MEGRGRLRLNITDKIQNDPFPFVTLCIPTYRRPGGSLSAPLTFLIYFVIRSLVGSDFATYGRKYNAFCTLVHRSGQSYHLTHAHPALLVTSRPNLQIPHYTNKIATLNNRLPFYA